MGISKALGGERIGSGNKMNVNLHGFERSTHDLGRIWRSSMAPGVLTPFMIEYGLNGDKWEIDLNTVVRTLPTEAPLFGSFKLQMDVYQIPIRLYINQLKNNRINVGMKMQNIALPQIKLTAKALKREREEPIEVQQFAQNSLNAYLGMRGVGYNFEDDESTEAVRHVNALGHLAYLDVFKNYYANKQEKKAWIVTPNETNANKINYIAARNSQGTITGFIDRPVENNKTPKNFSGGLGVEATSQIQINGVENLALEDLEYWSNGGGVWTQMTSVDWQVITPAGALPEDMVLRLIDPAGYANFTTIRVNNTALGNQEIQLRSFDLTDIDDIIEKASRNDNVIFDSTDKLPISANSKKILNNDNAWAWVGMNGLLVKTYNSDIFNNWVQTDWIDGNNGINAITAVDTSSGKFTMDTLNLAKKVYDMLNRIAVSGGTYEDWQEAVWGEKVQRQAQTPIYHGGASTEIVFNEVVSTAQVDRDALGTLGGKGTTSGKLKGGKVSIRIDEPSIIMGIVSITPRVDYSQGNKWFMKLKNMDNFHKPSLDGIGFQDLITDQMAYWDNWIDDVSQNDQPTTQSAGKQPAWLNYMTAVNETYGDFADPNKAMYMTLNRQYESEIQGAEGTLGIKDLTTYIDPMKYNYAFAYSNRDAQNFWVQIAMDITARRKMSAKIIPNL